MGRGHISDSKFELCKYSKIGRRYIDIEFGRINNVAVAIANKSETVVAISHRES